MLYNKYIGPRRMIWRLILAAHILIVVDISPNITFAGSGGINLSTKDLRRAGEIQKSQDDPNEKERDTLSLTLDETLLLTIKSRYEIQVAEDMIAQSKLEVGVARSARYPSLNLSVSNYYEDNLNEKEAVEYTYEAMGETYIITSKKDKQMHNSQAGLSLNLSLFSGGLISSRIESAKEQYALNRTLREKEIRDTLRSATIAWFNLVKNQNLVQIAQESLKQAKIIFRVAKERHRKGSISKLQRDRAKSKHVQSQIGLNNAETERLIAIHALLNEIGIGDQLKSVEAIEQRKNAETVLGDLSELTELALKKRPEIKSARHKYQIKKAELNAAKSKWSPTVDLQSEYLWKGYHEDSASDAWEDIEQNRWNVRLELNYNLFEGFKTKNQVSGAAIGLKSAKKEVQGIRLSIINDVNAAWERYHGDKKKMAYCKTSLELEKTNMKAVMKEYELGVATVDKVAEYYDSITNAKEQYVNALSDYEKSIIILKWATGGALP